MQQAALTSSLTEKQEVTSCSFLAYSCLRFQLRIFWFKWLCAYWGTCIVLLWNCSGLQKPMCSSWSIRVPLGTLKWWRLPSSRVINHPAAQAGYFLNFSHDPGPYFDTLIGFQYVSTFLSIRLTPCLFISYHLTNSIYMNLIASQGLTSICKSYIKSYHHLYFLYQCQNHLVYCQIGVVLKMF